MPKSFVMSAFTRLHTLAGDTYFNIKTNIHWVWVFVSVCKREGLFLLTNNHRYKKSEDREQKEERKRGREHLKNVTPTLSA